MHPPPGSGPGNGVVGLNNRSSKDTSKHHSQPSTIHLPNKRKESNKSEIIILEEAVPDTVPENKVESDPRSGMNMIIEEPKELVSVSSGNRAQIASPIPPIQAEVRFLKLKKWKI